MTRALDLVLGPLADLQAEGDVVVDGHVLEGGVVLEDEADVAPLRRRCRSTSSPEISTVPVVGLLEPGDDAQQRRLAAAARAQQRGQRAVGHVDRDVVEGDEVAEELGHVLDFDGHQCLLLDGLRGR